MDAAALVLAGRSEFGQLVLRAQNSDGGFGPYLHSPSEPFDTAISLLALKVARTGADAIVRGRAYLIRLQSDDGGWPETTRPIGLAKLRPAALDIGVGDDGST